MLTVELEQGGFSTSSHAGDEAHQIGSLDGRELT